jgi:hypothetical protein
MPVSREHALVEPRFLAAATLIGLGVGAGWALMFARLLILVGLMLSLAAAVGGIAIYARHFKRLSQVLKRRQRYDGPSLVELIIFVVVTTLIVILSPIIYFNVQVDEVILNKAELRLAPISFSNYPGTQQYFVNVQWTNRGSLTMTDAKMVMKGAIGPVKKVTEITEILNQLEKERVGLKQPNVSDALPGTTILATVPDMTLSVADINAVASGSAVLYVFYTVSYKDDAVRNKGEWRGLFCAYFTYRQNFYHNCGPNHFELKK